MKKCIVRGSVIVASLLSIVMMFLGTTGASAQTMIPQSGGGGIVQLTNVNSGLVLDVNHESKTRGAKVIQWPNHHGLNQEWNMVSVSQNVVQLVNVNSGMVLDVSGASKSRSAPVIQWPNHHGRNQEWKVVPTDKYATSWTFVNLNSGMVLDVSGASKRYGSPVFQWPNHNGPSQHWSFGDVQPVVPPSPNPITQTNLVVQGAVSCYSHPIVGVWVDDNVGYPEFAQWHSSSPNGYVGTFSTTIKENMPGYIQIHVGCGEGANYSTNNESWWSDNSTANIWISTLTYKGTATLSINCQEINAGTTVGDCSPSETSAEMAAIAWAKTWITDSTRNQSTDQKLYQPYGCLQFVDDAYVAAGFPAPALRPFVTSDVAINLNTFPVDIWGKDGKEHAQNVISSTDTNDYLYPTVFPPAGALVFYMANPGHDTTLAERQEFSHVTLSIGNGYEISTHDHTGELQDKLHPDLIHYEQIQGHDTNGSYDHYVGWWLIA